MRKPRRSRFPSVARRRLLRSPCSRHCCSGCRCSRRRPPITPSKSSAAFIARDRSSSAAGMSCCRCCNKPSCRAAGSATMNFLPATARRKPFPARSSLSPPIWGRRCRPSRMVGLAASSASRRSTCRPSSSSSARCHFGTPYVIAPGCNPRSKASIRRLSAFCLARFIRRSGPARFSARRISG